MTTPAKILIIDDDTDSREIMRVILTDASYQVETASGAAEGLAKFGTGENWDLLLLDQMMPNMSGLEVLRHLRARDPATRVIMVTAYATIDIAVDAMKGGAEDFLRKPFSLEALRGAVQAALARPRRSLTPVESAASGTATPGDVSDNTPFRVVNGYRFHRVPLPTNQSDVEEMQVCRAFEVQAPSGETRYCAVDVALLAREMMRVALGQEFSPVDPIWDRICESALANYLWEKAKISPQTLRVYDLTLDQIELARSLIESKPVQNVR